MALLSAQRNYTAREFTKQLKALGSPGEVEKVRRFFWEADERSASSKALGVPFGKVFELAKRFVAMPVGEIDTLLDSPFYEVRMGAVSIMDFQARARSIEPSHQRALYELYLRRHDRIDNWDLVDRAAPHVVGRHVADKPRDVLYRLARSKSPWERRTAIVSTYYFIRTGDVAETFKVSEILAEDDHELVQKAVGSWLREAGKKQQNRLLQFLDKHAARMPRTMLRYATEKLNANARRKFMARER